MKTGNRSPRRIAIAIALCLACVLLPAGQARTVRQKKQAARTQFEKAERIREALDGRPESQRTRRDYQKVIEAYRKVYYTAPTSNKADAAVLAVAELLDEQGRVLNDAKSYSDAVGQLVFLRREYPGSKYRVEALFTIGEIYRDDLNDSAKAKATFEDYLKYYPHSRLAPKAKQALEEINAAITTSPFKRKSPKSPLVAERSKTKAAWAETRRSREEEPATEAEKTAADKSSTAAPETRSTSAGGARTAPAEEPSAALNPAPALQQVDAAQGGPESHRLPRVTNVRHWSTPDYTRVAIDLEQEVQYQFGRVPRPDRIFFDLNDTKLAADLVGKSFDVEAGFLHRIRIAQYKSNMVRVVLDVNDVAEYSAFLLPNPYRLIIDIHGKLPPTQVASAEKSATKTQPQGQPQPKAQQPDSDVTVTHVKPAAPATSAAAAIDQAEKNKAGPLKRAAKDGDAKPSESADKDNAPASKSDKTVAVAKAEPPKVINDDATMDEPAKLTSKPTTGPTFQSIAPQQSSRRSKTAKPAKTPEVAPLANAHVAAPTATGERSLIRTLGLKIGRIVVDAGHGGHDTGARGPGGLLEKDLVLDVALKLGKLLESRLGAEVVYTRDDDTFIPLETRTAIANKEQADLFISIHANYSDDSTARGVETYYLNFTSSRDALEVAARENAVSEKSIHELQDLVKKIALKEKIEESREFAADVNQSLYAGLSAKSAAIRNRGVKKAPFIVLIGANMPSILAEISFVSNPTDAKKLKTSEYRQRIAESLYKGIDKYVSGLSGVKVASKVEDAGSERATAVAAVK